MAISYQGKTFAFQIGALGMYYNAFGIWVGWHKMPPTSKRFGRIWKKNFTFHLFVGPSENPGIRFCISNMWSYNY